MRVTIVSAIYLNHVFCNNINTNIKLWQRFHISPFGMMKGYPVIMGRKTFDLIRAKNLLIGNDNIVLTNNIYNNAKIHNFANTNIMTAYNVKDALRKAEACFVVRGLKNKNQSKSGEGILPSTQQGIL